MGVVSWQDLPLGAYYLSYNPDLGRWIQRDPIGYEGGINLYEYVGCNPVASVDSRGMAKGESGGSAHSYQALIGVWWHGALVAMMTAIAKEDKYLVKDNEMCPPEGQNVVGERVANEAAAAWNAFFRYWHTHPYPYYFTAQPSGQYPPPGGLPCPPGPCPAGMGFW